MCVTSASNLPSAVRSTVQVPVGEEGGWDLSDLSPVQDRAGVFMSGGWRLKLETAGLVLHRHLQVNEADHWKDLDDMRRHVRLSFMAVTLARS